MITLDQATSAVTILAAAFRSSMSQETAELYLRRFQAPPFTDFDILIATVSAAVDIAERLPPIAAILTAYQAEARARAAAALARDQRALEAAGHGRPRLDERYGREMVDVLRTALTEALPDPTPGETRGHTHQPGVPGAASCPVCAAAPETAARFEARVPELLAARNLVPATQPVQVYRCAPCRDSGFVTVDDNPATFTVKPCLECSPEATEAWANGDYGPRRGLTR